MRAKYTKEYKDLYPKCKRAVFKRIFTRPVRVFKDNPVYTGGTGCPAGSGSFEPIVLSTPPEPNPRAVSLCLFLGLFLWAIAAYLWWPILVVF